MKRKRKTFHLTSFNKHTSKVVNILQNTNIRQHCNTSVENTEFTHTARVGISQALAIFRRNEQRSPAGEGIQNP